MATVTPASFRSALYTRMRATAGVEFTDAQLDEAGRAAFNAAYPALYTRLRTSSLVPTYNTTTGYSTLSLAGITTADKVYRISDDEWDYDLRDWSGDGFETIRRLSGEFTAVTIHYVAPINYPTTSVSVPDEWLDALYTYAQMTLIEMLLNDYAQFRGYKPNTREGAVDENSLQAMHTNLYNKWTRERDERALMLPLGIA